MIYNFIRITSSLTEEIAIKMLENKGGIVFEGLEKEFGNKILIRDDSHFIYYSNIPVKQLIREGFKELFLTDYIKPLLPSSEFIMCNNKQCKVHIFCRRFTATPSDNQSYLVGALYGKKGCSKYIINDVLKNDIP